MKAFKLMFVASSDYDSLKTKGVGAMLSERSEGGFFERVISVHPLAKKSRVIPIKPGHDLVEFGFDFFRGGASSKLLRVLYSPFYIVRAAFGIARIVHEEGIDVVRASDPYWAALVAWLGTRRSNAHFVISVHADWDKRHQLDPKNGAPKLFGSRGAARLLARFLLGRAERVLCIRKSLFLPVERSGARLKALRLIPHGVDLTSFCGPSKPTIYAPPVGCKMVLFAGRLSCENYVDDVLELGRRFNAREDVLIVIAGGGPEEERLKKIIDSDPVLQKKLHFLGFVSRVQVLALRRVASVNLVLMGGYSLIESCASGRPTVAYDVEWHSELIEDGLSGRLVPEGDVDCLVSVIGSLLDDPDYAEKIGRNGREKAFRLHDMKKVFKIRASIYREILGEREG